MIMKKNVFTILVLLVASVTFAQDSLSVKLNQIDEYRNDILIHKEEYLCAKFPLNMFHVDENSGYIDYWKPDTIAFYFKDSCLVFIDHKTDRLVDDNLDTNDRRIFEYKRAFFYQGSLCLEEQYSDITTEGHRYIGMTRIDEMYHSITECCTYWDILIDKICAEKCWRTPITRPIHESKVDSVMNAKNWYFIDISKDRRDNGNLTSQYMYLKHIKRNGFILPEGVKLPYDIVIDNKK